IGIAVMELIGGYTDYVEKFEFLSDLRQKLAGTIFEKNNWLYTLFWRLGATLAYVYYFRGLLKSGSQQRVLKLMASGFVVACMVIISSNFNDFFVRSFPAITIMSSLLIIISTVMYLMQILQSDRIINFYRSLNFYMAAVLLVWNLIITPLIFYDVYYSRSDMPYVVLKHSIYLFSNIFMYLSFSIALLCCKPENL
ncbi:MAG: hypothetical protein HKO90_06560, partial [Flavobacteriaceae bacterium]|nr:hypothetical protein [Flavobacteriaceae bacterium]